MKQPNRIKAAMRAGRKACGYGLTFPSPWVIDILGKLDFDYVFIDGEHGPFDLERLEDLCRTAERYNLTTFARVPDIGSSTILRYLDRGIMGILGPHIATEADARQLVRACYFGPLGETFIRRQPRHRLQCRHPGQGGVLPRRERTDAGLRLAGGRSRGGEPGRHSRGAGHRSL